MLISSFNPKQVPRNHLDDPCNPRDFFKGVTESLNRAQWMVNLLEILLLTRHMIKKLHVLQ